MKKILLTLAFLATLQVAGAQDTKSVAEVQKAVEKAEKDAADAKKGAKMATWIKLGQTLMDAYTSPRGVGQIGQSQDELNVLMATTKAKSTKTVTVNGQKMTRKMYETCNYYYQGGKLQIIEVTKPVYEDALDRALRAYSKAFELDAKAQKTKDIKTAIQKIAAYDADEAFTAYQFKNYEKASKLYEASLIASGTAPCSEIDNGTYYYIAYTAMLAGKSQRAEEFFKKCLENKYYGESGDVYAKLAEMSDKAGDKAQSIKYLEEGFAQFPQSQALLVGMINYYVSTGSDSDKLFSLIESAKKNDPKNASLLYVEAQAREKLGQKDKALEAYDKCTKVDPKYEYGFIGKGLLLYAQANDLLKKAQDEMDNEKYNKLVKELEAKYRECVEPFEKAYSVSKDNKSAIAGYLKEICYRLSTVDESFKAQYEKYKAITDKK